MKRLLFAGLIALLAVASQLILNLGNNGTIYKDIAFPLHDTDSQEKYKMSAERSTMDSSLIIKTVEKSNTPVLFSYERCCTIKKYGVSESDTGRYDY